MKNRLLISPQGSLVRPTADKVRAAVFSSLSDAAEGCFFLDIFAGSGAVGIEAYSRGAAHITFIEKECVTLKQNLKLLPHSSYTLINGDFFNVKLKSKYDVIFIDPPYGTYSPDSILKRIFEQDLLKVNGIIVFEESTRLKSTWDNMPFAVVKQRKYGDTVITYLEHKEV